MEMLNIAHVTWTECEEVKDSLLVTVDSCRGAFSAFQDALASKDSQILLLQRSIQDRTALIAAQDVLIKDQKKTIRKLRLHKGLLGTLAVVEGAIIVWLLIR